ncbi:autotransporter family protein, partial [Saccharibacter floricola]
VTSTNGNVALNGTSQMGSLTTSGQGTQVALTNNAKIAGDLSNKDGAVTLKDSAAAGSLNNSGQGSSVSLFDHAAVGTLNNTDGKVALQGAGVHADTLSSSGGSVDVAQKATVNDLNIQNTALTLNDATVNGTLAASGTNTLGVGAQGANINTLSLHDGGNSIQMKNVDGNLTINSLKGTLRTPFGSGGNVIVNNANNNTLVFADNNTYSHEIKVNDGTVSVGDGKTSGYVTSDLNVNKGHIELNNVNNTNFANVISGDTDFTQNTNIATVFTGNHTYTGETHIRAGSLEVNGDESKATGDTKMDAGTTLSGQGTVGGSVNMASGSTLSPGTANNPLGSLTINKDLNMNQGSVLSVNALSQGTGKTITNDSGTTYNVLKSNSVVVNGTANFTGNDFHFHVTGDTSLRYGQAYVIATSSNKINVSDISQATKNLIANSNLTIGRSSFVIPELENISDPVLALVAARSNLTYASIATSRNTRAAGAGLDSLDVNTPLSQLFMPMSEGEARSHLGALSGEVHASVRTALIQDSFFVRDAVFDRLDSADCDGSSSNGISTASVKTGRKTSACLAHEPVLWGRALGSLGHNSGDGNASTMHHSTAGFIMGVDAPIFNTWRIGTMVSYGHSMFNINNGLSSSGHSDNISIGGYAGRHWGNLHLRLGASYTWNIMSMRRSVAINTFSDRLSSGYMGGTAQGFGELAYKIHAGKRTVFEPFANGAYVNQHTDHYREHGGSSALVGRSMNTGVTFATFGLRASTSFFMGRTLFTPHGSAAYRHTFGLTSSSVNQAFASTGLRNGMDVSSVPLSRDAAVVNLGVAAKLSDRVNVDLSYIGQYGNHSVDSGAQASVKAAF